MTAPSIRKTLLLRCGIGTAGLLCLLSAGVYWLARQSLYRELDESITQTAALLANQVEYEDYTISFEWKEGAGTNRALVENGLFQFWEENTGITTRSAALKFSDLPKFSGIGEQPLFRSILLPDGRRARAIGLRIHPFILPDEIKSMQAKGNVVDPKTMPFSLVVARDAEPAFRTLDRLRWLLSAGALLTLGLGFIIIQRIVGVSLRPIDELTAQIKDRTEHQLDSALILPDEMPVELTGLARGFDTLLSRVAAIRLRERDFIRHASHELRTPIAGLRATTDLALSQSRTTGEYRDHLTACQKAAVELGDLVKRLSALSRIGQEAATPRKEQVDPAGILAECLEPFLPVFEQRGLKVTRELPAAPMSAYGDVSLLRIIFNNLLDNAVSYAVPGGEIRIHGGIVNGKVEIRIANQAEDLPENLDRLFEPLFRRESSRNDAGVHLGIGLTLSLEAATAMGATLQVRKAEPGWIEFVLKMPGLISDSQPTTLAR